MSQRLKVTFAVTASLTLAVSAVALAGPLKGRTYTGAAPTSGVNNQRHVTIPLHAGGNIILRVSRSGSTVTVSFSSARAVLYCNTTQTLQVQKTTAARISSSGSFTATIDQRYSPGPGLPAIVQVVSGRFSGASVSGTIKTVQAECGGVAHFSAHA